MATGSEGRVRAFGDLLNQYLRQNAMMPRMKWRRLTRAWQESVDARTAQSTRIGGFDKGKLTIEVSSPALMQQLRAFRYREILERLRSCVGAGDVTRIQFRLVGAFRDEE